jgi:glycine/D-amino acid oxidase-like deaminating enzyme
MMPADHFQTCTAAPYWLEDVPLRPVRPEPLPAMVDLVVVGSGYTGLSAAITVARGGRSVLVLDAGPLGAGCSTRSGGQVAPSIKPEFTTLAGRHGPEVARAIRAEGYAALRHVRDFVAAEGIDCDWTQTGRYMAAHSPGEFAWIERMAEARVNAGEPAVQVVPPDRQHEELASGRYFGGVISPLNASVHPAKLHAGLLHVAESAGVALRAGAAVTEIERQASGFRVQTAGGTVTARDVLIATNGYTGTLAPWLRRRVIPIGSYMLATEPLDPQVAASLIPNRRMVVDTRKVVIYLRLSPDGRRLIFGGRAALSETDPMRSLPRLYEMMLEVFPQLAGTRVSHAWNGFVAYTFDELPHTGTHDGVHYAMGYCGSGISLSHYFGHRAGQRILGLAEGRTPLDNIPFQTRPFYAGRPWFLKPAMAWYSLKDRLAG